VSNRRQLPAPVRHFIHRIGFRGYFLATLAFVDVTQGFNFISPGSGAQAASNAYLADAIPFHEERTSLWVWAFAWWLTAAFCIVNAFRTTRDHWGFLAAIIIKVAYVVTLIYGSMHGMPDGTRRVIIWAWITTAVWVMSRLPEPPWELIELNGEIEDIERSREIPPPHRGGGEDA
jgi:hypothetical protein